MLPSVVKHADSDQAVPTRELRIGSRALSLALVLWPLYVLSIALLFASRVREFGDETDNLLGGVLVAQGQRLYVDFFSSHMPFPYYVAALPALFGVSTLEQFRLYSNALLVLATLAIVGSFRGRLPVHVLGLWATLTVFAHTLQWGEMLTASTCAGYGMFLAGLLFFTNPTLRFTARQLVALSVGVFVALQSELVAIFPLLLLGLCLVAVRLAAALRGSPRQEAAALLKATLTVAAPHLALLLGFWVTGILGDFSYYAYVFNQTYYARFVMNPSFVGMLHDWEAQYRTYLWLSLQQPLGVHAGLALANLIAGWLMLRTRGPVFAALYYLFIALTHVRDEGAYYLCSYFSLALDLAWAIGVFRARRQRWEAALACAILAVTAVFVVQIGRTYDLSGRPARNAPEVGIVQSLTAPQEQILVVPFDQYLYLASGRMPASMFSYYLPWHAVDPRIDARLLDDMRSTRPPIVIFHRNELVNDQWRPIEYGRRLYDTLLRDGYEPLDSSSELLGDVLVRQDRLTAARERLAAGQLGLGGPAAP
jgi:hypothetical protein